MTLRKIEVDRWRLPEKRLKLVPAEAGKCLSDRQGANMKLQTQKGLRLF